MVDSQRVFRGEERRRVEGILRSLVQTLKKLYQSNSIDVTTRSGKERQELRITALPNEHLSTTLISISTSTWDINTYLDIDPHTITTFYTITQTST
ncbi:hypothetical protein HBH56_238270 [Parastagonospora nodorum]|uniref:Uncharacterized protein n=1 Tax=Phaeosphaeria nodorum (strain SN15 / ATCC MYA-4574 / FGSC 10173) TaxID=321614 RepID=A0A7U2FAG9_PHANO|nr:hypothetical protein HBH56_238270 [Parastagonospora nodorum]QRD00684.1 hypothetical protein JI435_415620 [Parastagonospora nodorum SN15]KAH3925781.1 hypothetical protein HBH54_177060 [Parastagonospora nodorum]KAH4132431.1 hypothetical protein HBH45_180770 [Parastagonospora nodorum]KAH4146883.1 hypothetical protein HBH44_234520 [Parastagonospora nodorum]